MPELPEAREVVLRKFRPLAPPFHRHIVLCEAALRCEGRVLRRKLIGARVRAGDRVVVYEVAATVPDGDVSLAKKTEKTLLRFTE